MKFKCKTKTEYLLFFGLFYIYTCQLMNYTQFPITYVPEMVNRSEIINNINLIPFKKVQWSIMNYVLNIVLTAPFGFLFPLVKKQVTKKVIIIWAILLPILLEGLQLLIAFLTGYSDRMIDVNDIICNFIGVLLGFTILKLLVWCLKKFLSESTIQESGILRYIINR